MVETSWQDQFLHELNQAIAARQVGNEGKARVCARRAAGVVVGEYFQQRGIASSQPSAYDRLRYLMTLPDLPEDVLNITEHFLLRITEEHNLPIEADLIREALWLAQNLLGQTLTLPPSIDS